MACYEKCEEIIQTFTFLRDSIVLINLGIYVIDVQGLSGIDSGHRSQVRHCALPQLLGRHP